MTATITDNDAVGVEIGFSPRECMVSEGAGSVTLNVSVLGSIEIEPGVNVEVTVMTMDGSAVVGEDYRELSEMEMTLVFTSSVRELPVTVNIVGDTVVESDERFAVLELSGERVSSSSSRATVTIVNDDPLSITRPPSNNLPGVSVTTPSPDSGSGSR